jgi:hypothetical protein
MRNVDRFKVFVKRVIRQWAAHYFAERFFLLRRIQNKAY